MRPNNRVAQRAIIHFEATFCKYGRTRSEPGSTQRPALPGCHRSRTVDCLTKPAESNCQFVHVVSRTFSRLPLRISDKGQIANQGDSSPIEWPPRQSTSQCTAAANRDPERCVTHCAVAQTGNMCPQNKRRRSRTADQIAEAGRILSCA